VKIRHKWPQGDHFIAKDFALRFVEPQRQLIILNVILSARRLLPNIRIAENMRLPLPCRTSRGAKNNTQKEGD
jgi:hypothetical protein